MRVLIRIVIVPLLLMLLLSVAMAGSIPGGDGTITGSNLSDEVMAFKPLVEEIAAEFGMSDYLWHLLAIMQVESGGIGPDVMGRFDPVPDDLTPEQSIRAGVRRFATLYRRGETLGVDLETVIQAFDFGTTFLDYKQQNGGRYSFDLAVSYAAYRSDGVRIPYGHPLAITVNGGFRYDFGNMFFLSHVSRYLAVAGSPGAASETSGFLWPHPTHTRVSSGFGYRIHPISGTRRFHAGIDIPAPFGTPVLAVASGVVTRAAYNRGGWGNFVVIDHQNGYSTLYAHNSRNLVRAGDRVRQGDTIALVGSTGSSTGPHIHLEIHRNGRQVDPMPYFNR